MSESLVALARLAGISETWTDVFDAPHRVSPQTLRLVLGALGVACETPSDIAASVAALQRPSSPPPLVTADAGCEVVVPSSQGGGVEIDLPSGTIRPNVYHAAGQTAFIAPASPGYYPMRIGGAQTVLAVAPACASSVRDLTGKDRAFGSAVQVYSLRRPGDGGIGDFGAVGDAARVLAAQGADALAISPTHALFAAEPARASPYAPSSRLVLNPLLADPGCLFTERQIAAAWSRSEPRADQHIHLGGGRPASEASKLIDWAQSGHAKYAMLRALFDGLANAPAQRAAFEAYAAAARPDVTQHAVFEAIHAHEYARSGTWHWREWPTALHQPDSPAVAQFAASHRQDVAFHVFLQFLAERSLGDAQAQARAAGMGIGLIADLAVGMDSSGSHAWSRKQDILEGLTVGAPPDLLNRDGQGWGLTTFSPTALRASGFEPFLATLRAALRHAGGVRIDHVMGLRRLWLVPDGASPADGAYLDYPLIDFLRLVAIESHACGALVVGEDLGTVPPGFRAALSARGVLGMRVLPFERDDQLVGQADVDGDVRKGAHGDAAGSVGWRFLRPDAWQPDAMAMTSTHDLPPIAGWWIECDLAWRARLRGAAQPTPQAVQERQTERTRFWDAATDAGLAAGPAPDAAHAEDAVDAAIAYVAATPCTLAIVPIEDLLGLSEAPNLPGTVDEHPNWRRRLDAPIAEAMAAPRVATRLAVLQRRTAGQRWVPGPDRTAGHQRIGG